MEKKREIGIAIISLGVLALILLLILVFSILVSLILDSMRDTYMIGTYFVYVILGLSIGLSTGFGYVISKRLFDALFKE